MRPSKTTKQIILHISIQRDKILSHNGEAVFIIGNGFDIDIDIDLPASYAMYAQSDYWPFSQPVDIPQATPFGDSHRSLRDVCDQLRNMNNKRLDLLYGMNVFHILRTDGSDEVEIKAFIENIRIQAKEYKGLHNIKD